MGGHRFCCAPHGAKNAISHFEYRSNPGTGRIVGLSARRLLKMRTLTLFPVTAALMTLSGCAGWVVFGHTIEGKPPAAAPAATQLSPAAEPAQSPATANALTAAQPNPAAQPATTSPASPDAPLLKAVTVTFTPAAQQKIAAEPQFQQAMLLTTIENDLRAHNLLAANDPHARGTLKISIDDFATHPASNAVVFGYMLGTSTLTANIEVHTAAGKDSRDTRITAESRVAKSANGGQTNPFDPLYHRFAAATVSSLSGATAQAKEPHWGQD
jgi:hypothetical protein